MTMETNVDELLTEMYRYALLNSVPVMEEDGLTFLTGYLQSRNVKSMLEIGTAIGYSSIKIAHENPQIERILSLEIDEERCSIARNNVRLAAMEDRIEIINCDCRLFSTDEKFDCIFLDGPKAHNQQLFDNLEKNLNSRGVIIIDDIYFHGYLENPQVIRTKRLRALVRKLQKFKDDFTNNPDYTVSYLEIGDGILIGEKKE